MSRMTRKKSNNAPLVDVNASPGDSQTHSKGSPDASGETIVETVTVKKKRGRKPSKNRKGYFYEEQEKAVVDYITSTDERERNRIFNSVLRPAFTKMIESIIRRYSLFPPDEEFQETFDDTMSFLMSKLSYFDPTTNYKAYSYCGTICKNYLIYKINKFAKNQKMNESYDSQSCELRNYIDNSINYSYDSENSKSAFISELTGSTVENIGKLLDNRDVLRLTENEVKVGTALLTLMSNWEDIFAQMGSNKFNKSSILLFIKETTRLNAAEIRESLKVYKNKYYEVKHDIINE